MAELKSDYNNFYDAEAPAKGLRFPETLEGLGHALDELNGVIGEAEARLDRLLRPSPATLAIGKDAPEADALSPMHSSVRQSITRLQRLTGELRGIIGRVDL